MDAIDHKILAVLQEDASLSVAEIGQRVGLSSTPCWKRIQRLEAEGVILKRVALIEKDKVGGTCLHRGCIPTKALLHAAEIADQAKESAKFGVRPQMILPRPKPTTEIRKVGSVRKRPTRSPDGRMSRVRGIA